MNGIVERILSQLGAENSLWCFVLSSCIEKSLYLTDYHLSLDALWNVIYRVVGADKLTTFGGMGGRGVWIAGPWANQRHTEVASFQRLASQYINFPGKFEQSTCFIIPRPWNICEIHVVICRELIYIWLVLYQTFHWYLSRERLQLTFLIFIFLRINFFLVANCEWRKAQHGSSLWSHHDP